MRVIALACLLFLAALARDGWDAWIDGMVLPPLGTEVSQVIVDRTGTPLRIYPVADGLIRLPVTLEEVDPAFIAALIAYEDQRFHAHSGVDPRAVLRAGRDALRAGQVTSGASTLTMQVARLLEDGETGRLRGKLRQARVALALERRLSKAEILTLYLHHAPYGGRVEGLRAAALTWFGRTPDRLTPAQIALLVALPQAPEARRPDRHPDAALRAVRHVTERLVARGVFDAEARDGLAVPREMAAMPQDAPHLADRLRRQTPEAQQIDTTLDRTLQRRVQALGAEAAAGLGPGVSAAVIVADHTAGEVLAQVGSAAYRADGRGGFVDASRAVRSPGSTLKPMVYAMAFDEGRARPETLLPDAPHDFAGYAPVNFDGVFRGDIAAREALRLSLNLPVVHLTERIGPARLHAKLAEAGADVAVPGAPGLALSLGGGGVSLEGLVTLYATLARGGSRVGLTITPRAQMPPVRRVLSARSAWQVSDILATTPAPLGHRSGRIAHKTGTSYGHRDVWAVGYDGRHVVGVWLGRPDGTPIPGAFGADAAAPLLFSIFGHLEEAPLPPPPPDAVIASLAELLPHLRRLDQAREGPALDLVFPPAGAELVAGGQMPGRLRHGAPPYTWLLSGAPLTTTRRGEVMFGPLSPGFHTLTVIDAAGASDRAAFRVVE
ncbi:MAG: penicillin-binding protein 1C [Shimia sp.]